MSAMAALKAAEEKDTSTVEPLLRVLDGQLQHRDYVLGGLTVVDFALVAYLLTKMGRQLDYSATPWLAAWRERMAALKGFVETEVKGPPARRE